MGIYDREYYQEQEPGFQVRFPQTITGQLILANVVVYVLDALILRQAGIQDALALYGTDLKTPWTWWRLVTYGFLHDRDSVFHLLGNMMGLYFFGREVETIYGARKYLRFYLSAIVLSGFVWLLNSAWLGGNGPVVGASGAITSIIMLFVFHFPHRTVLLNFFIPVPAWVLGVFLIVMNLLGERQGEGRVAYDVHLAGAAYGWIFYKLQWDLLSFFPGQGWPKFPRIRRSPQLKIHQPSRSSDQLAEQADAILEKLHRQGEQSLTSRERAILEEYSRSVRNRRG